MRIRDTEQRERRWDALQEATRENTVAGAIDVAVAYYLIMRGDNVLAPTGAVEELMERATQEGSVTASEIAESLDCDELPVKHTETWDFGRED